MPRAPRDDVAESPAGIERTARWLETAVVDSDGYRFAEGCPKTLLATCFGVLAHELLGGFAHLSPERRGVLARAIQARQSAQTGLFRDPLHGDDVVFRLKKFTPQYIEWQETYFALHALDALGEKPLHPLRFFEPFRDPLVLETWIRGFSFDDFWFVSNSVMFLLFFAVWAEGADSTTARQILDQLDARQDPRTGYWGTEQGASLFNGMAGAFHIYGFYRFLSRPIQHQDAAIRATLRLQEKTGLFGGPSGGACEDLDAVDILAKLDPSTAQLERDVHAALERTLGGLRACRRPDGGYSWLSAEGGVKPGRIVYSGLETLSVSSDQSDVWSTWFRPLAIALVRDRLGWEPAWPVRYRRLPLLGWHAPRR